MGYVAWLAAYTISIALSKQGYDQPWVPEQEKHRWYSPLGLNALAAVLDIALRFPLFLFGVGAFAKGAATANGLAHTRLK